MRGVRLDHFPRADVQGSGDVQNRELVLGGSFA